MAAEATTIEDYRRALDDAARGGELLKGALGVLREKPATADGVTRNLPLAAEIDRVVGRVEGLILLECPAARRPKVKRLGAGTGP